jgi:hypothetical protein
VIRLTGLPSRSRCPRVAVRRGDGGIEIVFSGLDAEVRMDVEERYLGGADVEAEELRLLARLQAMGYRVTRLPPRGGRPRPGLTRPGPGRGPPPGQLRGIIPCGSPPRRLLRIVALRYTISRVSVGFVAPASEVPSVWVNVLVGIPPNMVDRPMSVSGLLKTRTQMRSVVPTLRM